MELVALRTMKWRKKNYKLLICVFTDSPTLDYNNNKSVLSTESDVSWTVTQKLSADMHQNSFSFQLLIELNCWIYARNFAREKHSFFHELEQVLRTPDGIYVALSLHLCLLQHKDSNTHTHSLFFVNQIMMCAQKVSMIRANRGKKK